MVLLILVFAIFFSLIYNVYATQPLPFMVNQCYLEYYGGTGQTWLYEDQLPNAIPGVQTYYCPWIAGVKGELVCSVPLNLRPIEHVINGTLLKGVLKCPFISPPLVIFDGPTEAIDKNDGAILKSLDLVPKREFSLDELALFKTELIAQDNNDSIPNNAICLGYAMVNPNNSSALCPNGPTYCRYLNLREWGHFPEYVVKSSESTFSNLLPTVSPPLELNDKCPEIYNFTSSPLSFNLSLTAALCVNEQNSIRVDSLIGSLLAYYDDVFAPAQPMIVKGVTGLYVELNDGASCGSGEYQGYTLRCYYNIPKDGILGLMLTRYNPYGS